MSSLGKPCALGCQFVARHRRVEIGFTWYRRDVQGGAVNPACKFLLLDHAFGSGVRRVEFKTDLANARSRAALVKLGATEQGVLHSHMVRRDGSPRDSVYFSILAEEWPDRRRTLLRRLEKIAA